MRYVVLTIALVATALAAQGFAEPIAVSNASFEDGPLPPNYVTPDGWGGAFVTESAGVGLTAGTTGSYVGQISSGDGTSAYGYQNVGRQFVDGTAYTLTAALGMRSDRLGQSWFATSLDWAMSLNYADTGEQVAVLSGTIQSNVSQAGFLTDTNLQYVANAADSAHGIQIRFLASAVGKSNMSGNLNDGGPNAFLSVDHVQFSAIPEPSSIVLLSVGLVGLLAYAWRKRK
jgi:hypothetical protein